MLCASSLMVVKYQMYVYVLCEKNLDIKEHLNIVLESPKTVLVGVLMKVCSKYNKKSWMKLWHSASDVYVEIDFL